VKSIPLLALLLALAPGSPLPAQTVVIRPYVQPGNGAELGAADVKVVAWLTDQTAGDFRVEFGPTTAFGSVTAPARVSLGASEKLRYFKYAATLTNLPFNARIHYRVTLAGKSVGEGAFPTRKTRDQPIRFALTGDTGDGKADQRQIAWQLGQAKPEFLLIAGDIVYSRGLLSEYLAKFWPVYNDPRNNGPTNGAPIFSSIPLYAVLGNHDVGASNLTFNADGYAAFYLHHPPLNGPKANPWNTPIVGPPEQVAAFKQAAGTAYPALCNYSFDNGPAHFLCLDANRYVAVNDENLRNWIRSDLTRSQARWKFVVFHHPGFQSSLKHYSEQKMRLLAPLFEQCGVDVVFSGHVHNYQRSKPLKFKPDSDKPAARGAVNGKFTLDTVFDGKSQTQPKGVVYIVSGGGGASLYDPDLTDAPDKWEHDKANWAPFTEKFISDRHSFSLVEVDPGRLTLRQLDEDGKEVDRMVITKSP
jgi:acid phosphatase type 7